MIMKEKKMEQGGDFVSTEKKKLKIPKKHLYFAEDVDIQLQQDSAEDKEFFSMKAYSGKPIKGHWLWGDLAIDVSGVQFNGKRFPILEQHELDKKIGVANKKPDISNNDIVFDKINLLSNETAQEFKGNLNDGFPYQASIGIRPLVIEELSDGESAEVNGYKLKGPAAIIRKSNFREASVCVFGADPNTSVAAFSDEEEELDIELISSKQEKEETEEKSMTLQELQEKYPDLFAEIQNKDSEKDQKIQELSDQIQSVTKERDGLKKEKENLSETAQKYEERIVNLEKTEQLRKEKEIKNQADSIVGAKLGEFSIPKRLHDKIKKQFDHNKFVDESNSFDEAKFTEVVEAELKDWSEAMSEVTKPSSVQGFGSFEENQKYSDNSETEIDSDVDRLFGYLNKAETK